MPSNKTKTTIEIDKDIWAKIRQIAYDKGKTNSEVVEKILKEKLEEEK